MALEDWGRFTKPEKAGRDKELIDDIVETLKSMPKAPPPKAQMNLLSSNGEDAKQSQTTSDKDALPEAT